MCHWTPSKPQTPKLLARTWHWCPQWWWDNKLTQLMTLSMYIQHHTYNFNFFQLNIFYFMEIQHNFKSFAGRLLYILYSFLHFLYFKTWSLVQQYHKQSLMSQMEPLMTINYTCHAKVSRWYIGTFIFTRLTFKWTISRSWINMIKRHWNYKRNFLHSKRSRKRSQGCLRRVTA